MSFQDRIQILDKNGNFISQFGQTGDGIIEFSRVKGISINLDRIIVADSENNRFQVIGTDGLFKQAIGSEGIDSSQFVFPTGVFFNGEKLFVIDSGNNRVQVFNYIDIPDIIVPPETPIDSFRKSFVTALKKSLPTGDAFQGEPNTDSHKYHEATSTVFAEALDDFISVQNLTIPKVPVDEDFTIQDLMRLENAYGLLINNSVPTQDRVNSVLQKMRGAFGYEGRSSAQWLQDQLFNAGFEVYVLENKFSDGGGGYETKIPRWEFGDIFLASDEYMGNETPPKEAIMGRNTLTVTSEPKIVNSIYPEEDSAFDLGDLEDENNPLLKGTFFLTGGTGGAVGVKGIADYDSDASIPANRELEFRILVLANKPAHTVALQHIKLT